MNKKQYLMLAVPVLSLFLICSVLAMPYSIRGSQVVAQEGFAYKVNVKAWHTDGKTYNSHGQGQGTLTLQSLTKGVNMNVNANFKETGLTMSPNGCTVEITTDMRTIVWMKGMYPMSMYMPLTYDYNTCTQTFSLVGSDINIPVTNLK